MDKDVSREEILRALKELAFGRCNDAVKLAFEKDVDADKIDGLDLSSVESVHKLNNGSVDMKMIDRAKLIGLLLTATADRGTDSGFGGLIGAINNAAGKVFQGEAEESDE